MMTQKQLAFSIQVTQQSISYILSGKRKPSADMALKLAEATNTSPMLWLYGTPEEKRKALETYEPKAPSK